MNWIAKSSSLSVNLPSDWLSMKPPLIRLERAKRYKKRKTTACLTHVQNIISSVHVKKQLNATWRLPKRNVVQTCYWKKMWFMYIYCTISSISSCGHKSTRGSSSHFFFFLMISIGGFLLFQKFFTLLKKIVISDNKNIDNKAFQKAFDFKF